MQALVKEKDRPAATLREVPRPRPAADEVLVEVALAGLCRTDLAVASGRVPTALDPLVLGHEFAGTVREAGPGVKHLATGDRVAVMPALPCGACRPCAGHDPGGAFCANPAMLGVDRHGAFAEYVAVPAASAHRIPPKMSWALAAYAEPVAAALAVLRAGLPPGGRGLIHGGNRIAILTHRVLRAHGFSDVQVLDPGDGPAPPDAYDFVIETAGRAEVLAALMTAARPGGTVVLKSRPPDPVGLPLHLAVRKELTLRAVHYGPFPRALALLAEGRLDVADLLGECHPLSGFAAVFAAAQASEARKAFFAPGGGPRT